MRRIALLVLPVLLTACAVTPRPPAGAGTVVDTDVVQDWAVAGRIAIAVANDGGSGRFDWAQRAATTELQLRGPLGVGALRIVTDGAHLTLTTAEGEDLDAGAAREALQARLGADLPLTEMRYWLLGLPAPAPAAQVTADAAGVPRAIEQSGWTVTYEPFTRVQGWSVPTRLTALSAHGRVKVILDEWRLPAADASGPIERAR